MRKRFCRSRSRVRRGTFPSAQRGMALMRSAIALEISVTPVMIIQVAKRNASASGPAPGSASMANVIVSRCLFDVREGQSAIGIGDTDDLIELCWVRCLRSRAYRINPAACGTRCTGADRALDRNRRRCDDGTLSVALEVSFIGLHGDRLPYLGPSHFQLRISGRSCPCLQIYCLCSTSLSLSCSLR
jgi:hypothetical protein